MIIAERSQQLIALCQSLVQNQSYSGHKDDVVKRMKLAFEQWKFDEVIVDSYGSELGHVKGNRPS